MLSKSYTVVLCYRYICSFRGLVVRTVLLDSFLLPNSTADKRFIIDSEIKVSDHRVLSHFTMRSKGEENCRSQAWAASPIQSAPSFLKNCDNKYSSTFMLGFSGIINVGYLRKIAVGIKSWKLKISVTSRCETTTRTSQNWRSCRIYREEPTSQIMVS